MVKTVLYQVIFEVVNKKGSKRYEEGQHSMVIRARNAKEARNVAINRMSAFEFELKNISARKL